MAETNPLNYEVAARDFQQARRQAAMQQILARMKGQSAELLCYDEVRRQLGAGETIKRGLQEVPLDAIVGSVGRYQDFTRSFLPKRDSDEARWAGVKAAIMDMKGMPPIEVYQVGAAYFVKDGNHRVSVARQLGTTTISAYVTEVQTRVPLTPDDDPEEVICKARYADFLVQTNLDKLRPNANLKMTFCGQFTVLHRQIETEYRLLKDGNGVEVGYETAVSKWYDEVYLPVARLIREQGVLRDFPERTEADIFILLSEFREELTEALGWHVDTATAVSHLADEKGKPPPLAARVGKRLLGVLRPSELADGPVPGQWRKERLGVLAKGHLFSDILLTVRGKPQDWEALALAIEVAQGENGRILGLHVVSDWAQYESAAGREKRAVFEERCQMAGVPAEWAVEIGSKMAPIILRRAAWSDLVVVPLDFLSDEAPINRLGSGVKALIQHCPRPILAVPGTASAMDRALLAYDGRPKSDEALYMAAYWVARRGVRLTVLTVETPFTNEDAMQRARTYLGGQGIEADYVLRQHPIAEAVLDTAVAHDCNLLIMGGFGRRPVLHLVLGSTVDRVLQEFGWPILICR